jgi:hypothetical protein
VEKYIQDLLRGGGCKINVPRSNVKMGVEPISIVLPLN